MKQTSFFVSFADRQQFNHCINIPFLDRPPINGDHPGQPGPSRSPASKDSRMCNRPDQRSFFNLKLGCSLDDPVVLADLNTGSLRKPDFSLGRRISKPVLLYLRPVTFVIEPFCTRHLALGFGCFQNKLMQPDHCHPSRDLHSFSPARN